MSEEGRVTRGEFFRQFLKHAAGAVVPERAGEKAGGGVPDPPERPRPPWAVEDFLDKCDRCGDCASSCPTGVIAVHPEAAGERAGVPYLDFFASMCDFCGDCVAACKTGALDKAEGAAKPGEAVILGSCLANRGIVCDACVGYCCEEAIVADAGGGVSIIAEKCTGCGACVLSCVGRSITINP